MNADEAMRWTRRLRPEVTPVVASTLADEVDRLTAKLAAIHAMLPRLTQHLPGELAAELAAHIYVLPFRPPTDADVRRGQEISAEIAGTPQ